MGCGGSNAAAAASAKKANANSQEVAKRRAIEAAAAKIKRAKLDPKDFIISKKSSETAIREPGSINGEQFNIETCKDCDIFLLDYMDSSFVDDCEGCRIFIGPAVSSVFIRNCKSCSFVIACRQLRTRDCTDCRFALLCTTEPVIEKSVGMQFACFDFVYFSLREQLEQSGLAVWNNKWSQVYDFNVNADKPNWNLLPEAQVASLLCLDRCTALSPEEFALDRVIPVTLGSRPRPHQESCFVVFLPRSEVFVEAFLSCASRSSGWVICRTRSTCLAQDRAKQLFSWTKEPLAKLCAGQEVMGVEVCGRSIQAQVSEALTTSGLAAGSKSIRMVPEAQTETLAKAFFEVWKDEI